MILLLPCLPDCLLLGTFLLLLLFSLNLFIYLFCFVLPLISRLGIKFKDLLLLFLFLFDWFHIVPKNFPQNPQSRSQGLSFSSGNYSNINCGNYCWLKIGCKHWFLGSFMRNPNRFFVVFCLILCFVWFVLRNCFSFSINALGYYINFNFFFFFLAYEYWYRKKLPINEEKQGKGDVVRKCGCGCKKMFALLSTLFY